MTKISNKTLAILEHTQSKTQIRILSEDVEFVYGHLYGYTELEIKIWKVNLNNFRTISGKEWHG